MPRRRGPGVAGIRRRAEQQKKAEQVGQEIQADNLEHISKQLALFKRNLEKFASKHKNQINKNLKFRRQFQSMCKRAGVDPLASNKGIWGQLLGMGDFYYELGVQIVDVCLASRAENGGLMYMSELLDRLMKMRGSRSQKISSDDVLQATKTIAKLGAGFEIVDVGHRKMVLSVPYEMNRDHTAVIEAAQANGGYLVLGAALARLKWEEQRFRAVLDLMLQEGMVWIDGQHEQGTAYWFPSLQKQSLT